MQSDLFLAASLFQDDTTLQIKLSVSVIVIVYPISIPIYRKLLIRQDCFRDSHCTRMKITAYRKSRSKSLLVERGGNPTYRSICLQARNFACQFIFRYLSIKYR
jgi:hypothetical protein